MIYADDFPKPQAPFVEPRQPDRPTITCPHCGNSIVLILPIELRMFSELVSAFSKLHKHCATQKIFEKTS